MADEKPAASGGNGWGPLEIILVLILGIALLDHFTGRQTVLFPEKGTPVGTSTSSSVTKNGCGLTIISPTMNMPVGSSITILGSVAGCNWHATNTIALYAQVVDAEGIPVSAYEAIPPSTTKENGEVSFATTIQLTTTPNTPKGTIIFIPAVPVPDRSVTIRMPLVFTTR